LTGHHDYHIKVLKSHVRLHRGGVTAHVSPPRTTVMVAALLSRRAGGQARCSAFMYTVFKVAEKIGILPGVSSLELMLTKVVGRC
jgi:hypothetical protein